MSGDDVTMTRALAVISAHAHLRDEDDSGGGADINEVNTSNLSSQSHHALISLLIVLYFGADITEVSGTEMSRSVNSLINLFVQWFSYLVN